MIKGQKVLGVITARGGSKGLPGKNIRVVGGKPMIAWSILAGQGSRYLDRLILSTEDDEIMEVARSYGCEVPFRRDARLSADETPGMDVVLDAMERCRGFDWIVQLQPTSPLRLAEDIDAALELCVERDAPACVSVVAAKQPPQWMYFVGSDLTMTPVIEYPRSARRQDLPQAFALNGAVYVAQQKWLETNRDFKAAGSLAYRMPPERSVDVDTELDLWMAERYLTARRCAASV